MTLRGQQRRDKGEGVLTAPEAPSTSRRVTWANTDPPTVPGISSSHVSTFLPTETLPASHVFSPFLDSYTHFPPS